MTPPRAAARTVAPETVAEACSEVRAAHLRGDALGFVGGGTKLALGYPPERLDMLVRTERLARIAEYAPADMTVTVEAGLTLTALQAELAPQRQRLALDAPLPDRATIGGLIATNAFGPLRARYGSIRDLIVGISIVRADGALARGGGKVVKNVAGFDIPKLMVGSLGTLGLIATATFRLHPLPEAQHRLVVSDSSADDVRALCRAIVDAQLEPAAVVTLRDNRDRWAVIVQFEGFGAGVEEQAALFSARSAALERPARELEGGGIGAFGRTHDDARTGGDTRAKAAFPPASFSAIDRDALAPLAAALGGAACAAYPTLGVAFCSGACVDVHRVAGALSAARVVLERAGGSLVVEDAPDAVRERVDVFGALPSSFDIMRRLKERFDPQRRCNPGRFVGRL